MTAEPVRIAHLSDTHFLEPGAEAEGGFGYDTQEAFDAVHDHVGGAAGHDLVVVTGDVADHGRSEQYRLAAESFARFEAPVNVCPGNHDLDAPFMTGMGRPTVATSRVIEAGSWCFLFVDSNAGAMVAHDSGRHVDPADPADRLHRNGALGERESSWIRHMCEVTVADHVFVWVHHPPAASIALTDDPAYSAEWEPLLADLPMIRGIGGGHTHVPDEYEVDGRPVFVAPALKNNFDLVAETLLPPGYRTYEFAPDGGITGRLHLLDDPRWPRHPMPRSVVALFRGELTFAEFDEIVARRRLAE